MKSSYYHLQKWRDIFISNFSQAKISQKNRKVGEANLNKNNSCHPFLQPSDHCHFKSPISNNQKVRIGLFYFFHFHISFCAVLFHNFSHFSLQNESHFCFNKYSSFNAQCIPISTSDCEIYFTKLHLLRDVHTQTWHGEAILHPQQLNDTSTWLQD